MNRDNKCNAVASSDFGSDFSLPAMFLTRWIFQVEAAIVAVDDAASVNTVQVYMAANIIEKGTFAAHYDFIYRIVEQRPPPILGRPSGSTVRTCFFAAY